MAIDYRIILRKRRPLLTGIAPRQDNEPERVIKYGEFTFYPERNQLLKGSPETSVVLPEREARLLELFISSPGRVLSDEYLINQVHIGGESPLRLVRFVSSLRKFIGDHKIVPNMQGYLYINRRINIDYSGYIFDIPKISPDQS